MAKSSSHLNNRKPFKLLVHFQQEELDLLHAELQFLSGASSGKRYKRLLQYYSRWVELDARVRPVTRREFVQGTDLPVSANAFDKLTSAFYNHLQEFLARRELVADPLYLQQMAFRAYCHRDFDWSEIRRRHGEAHRELDKLPQTSGLSRSRISLDLDLAGLANDRTITPAERGYTELLQTLEADYVTQKLRLLCAIANDHKIFEAPSPDLAISSTLPPFRSSWPTLTRMYYGAYQLLTGEDDAASRADLRHMLEQQDPRSPTFPQEDMLDLYGYLLNALAKKVNAGDQEALGELSALHDILIDQEILLENGRISPEHFKNVITVKLKNGEVAAARHRFNQLEGKISNDPDENAVRYNHTRLLFAENHLEEAAAQLEQLCGQTGNLKLDNFYGLDLRILLLKVYFDLLKAEGTDPELWDETDEKMVRLLEAFKGYIERKKIPEPRKQDYEGLRKLFQAIYALAFRGGAEPNREEIQQLEADFRGSRRAHDPWFRQRLDWLKSRE